MYILWYYKNKLLLIIYIFKSIVKKSYIFYYVKKFELTFAILLVVKIILTYQCYLNNYKFILIESLYICKIYIYNNSCYMHKSTCVSLMS